jgi:hypothetical protein
MDGWSETDGWIKTVGRIETEGWTEVAGVRLSSCCKRRRWSPMLANSVMEEIVA